MTANITSRTHSTPFDYGSFDYEATLHRGDGLQESAEEILSHFAATVNTMTDKAINQLNTEFDLGTFPKGAERHASERSMTISGSTLRLSIFAEVTCQVPPILLAMSVGRIMDRADHCMLHLLDPKSYAALGKLALADLLMSAFLGETTFPGEGAGSPTDILGFNAESHDGHTDDDFPRGMYL